MGNIHFAKIGDVWKHLILAEALDHERPPRYWESNAGSALYPLTHSAERDYGVFRFYDGVRVSHHLQRTCYTGILAGLAFPARDYPAFYPGSPYIAMSVLSREAQYLFCDLDPESLRTIEQAASALGLTPGDVEVRNSDGVATLLERASLLDIEDRRQTFVHMDPCGGFVEGQYLLDDPYVSRSDGTPGPLEAFLSLGQLGLRGIFWYGFDSPGTPFARDVVHNRIRTSLANSGLKFAAEALWCGEVFLSSTDGPISDMGVMGCGVLCLNLKPRTVSTCELLGEGLADIYRDALLPDGSSGALSFSSFSSFSSLDFPAQGR